MLNKIIRRLFFVVVLAVLILSSISCVALMAAQLVEGASSGKETKQSKIFLDGANEILLAKGEGMLPAQFKLAFEKKFPGVKGFTTASTRLDITTFTYNQRNYWMKYTGFNSGNNKSTYKFSSAAECLDETPQE